ncbi:MAG: hypothetical protein R6U13_07655, partial [Desulfatiglandaceae bacterium]
MAVRRAGLLLSFLKAKHGTEAVVSENLDFNCGCGEFYMAQVFLMLNGDCVETARLPDPSEQLLPGIRWGRFQDFFTPAFWYTQVLMAEHRGFPEKPRLGNTLAEEVAACLLGGYGMRAELGLLAFR